MPSRLAEHLVARGLLTKDQAAEALRAAGQPDVSIEDWVLQQRLVPEASVLHALGEVSGLRAVHLPDFEPNRDMAALVPAKIAEQLNVVPLSVDGNTLHVACAYPIRRSEVEEVGFLLGKQLMFWVAPRIRVREWMSILYGRALLPRDQRLVALLRLPTPANAATIPSPRRAEPAAAPRPSGAAGVASAPVARHSGPLLEETTLEESLSRDWVESLARQVLEEPMLLEQRKVRPPAPEATSAPAARVESKSAPQEPLTAVQPAPAPSPAAVAIPSRTPEPTDDTPIELAEARTRVEAAGATREALLDAVMRFALGTFDYAAAFAVIRGVAAGWTARGEGADPQRVAAVSIPLDSVSVFRTVALTRSSYLGPVPADALSKAFLEQLGRNPRTVFVFPIEVKGRIVAILYGDGGQKPLSQRRVADFILFCQELPAAFERLILTKRAEANVARGALPEELQVSAPTPRAGSGWSPQSPEPSPGPGRATSHPARTQSEGERPPPDFEPILRRLVGPDAAQRARAMAELARAPEASAKVLCQSFPGPTAWGKAPLADLPEADELGPIPGALSRLGRPAAQQLATLLDDDDATRRYFALLTAGSLPYPELVPGLLRGLFDLESDVSSAARAASSSFRRLPRFDASLKSIRQELASIDPLRRSLAARALGALHDREAIDGLIGLTASDDALCAQAAAQALTDITFGSFGLDTRGWSRWWAENRGRRRADWLLAALRSSALELRLAALDELTRITGDPYGYVADGPPAQRELALKKWEGALVQDPRLRRVD